ncbi:MAG: lysostaphin resistance A-like protein [Pseudobdellovibrionaceae bacterium]
MLDKEKIKFVSLLIAMMIAASIYPALILGVLLAVPKIRKLLRSAYNLDGINKENLFFTALSSLLFFMIIFSFLVSQVEVDAKDLPSLVSSLSLDRIITAIIIAPILEEFVFRYLLLGNLLRRYSISISIFLCSIAFGILHHGLSFKSLSATIAGVLLSIIFVKTRSTSLTASIHVAHNSCVIIFVYWLSKYGHPNLSQNQKYYLLTVAALCAIALSIMVIKEVKRWKNLDFT